MSFQKWSLFRAHSWIFEGVCQQKTHTTFRIFPSHVRQKPPKKTCPQKVKRHVQRAPPSSVEAKWGGQIYMIVCLLYTMLRVWSYNIYLTGWIYKYIYIEYIVYIYIYLQKCIMYMYIYSILSCIHVYLYIFAFMCRVIHLQLYIFIDISYTWLHDCYMWIYFFIKCLGLVYPFAPHRAGYSFGRDLNLAAWGGFTLLSSPWYEVGRFLFVSRSGNLMGFGWNVSIVSSSKCCQDFRCLTLVSKQCIAIIISTIITVIITITTVNYYCISCQELTHKIRKTKPFCWAESINPSMTYRSVSDIATVEIVQCHHGNP